MRILLALAAILFIRADSLDFENGAPGSMPAGWSAATTGKGSGSMWMITTSPREKSGNKVLTQTSNAGPKALFNLCVYDKVDQSDVDLSVSVKAIDGKIDRGGGPVWRYQDADNYYIARWNPLEDNFRVYKVVGGKRTQLATQAVKLPVDQWHTIRVLHTGNHIRCYLNGTLYLDTSDSTFSRAGKIGLWTKADAVTSFDDLSVTPLQSR